MADCYPKSLYELQSYRHCSGFSLICLLTKHLVLLHCVFLSHPGECIVLCCELILICLITKRVMHKFLNNCYLDILLYKVLFFLPVFSLYCVFFAVIIYYLCILDPSPHYMHCKYLLPPYGLIFLPFICVCC